MAEFRVYDDYLDWLSGARHEVLQLVKDAEAAFVASGKPEMEQHPLAKSFSPLLWQAFCQNTFKLIGVKRITGGPYATHPTRMAMTLLKAITDPVNRERAALYALFHDYLEEGDGRTRSGVELFRKEYPGHHEAVLCAILLSEPQINYDLFDERRKTMEYVAYVAQLVDVRSRLEDESLYTAALADKMDNLHDLDYITANPKFSPEKIHSRLQEKFGYFRFVLDTLGPSAAPEFAGLLEEGLARVAAQHGFSAQAVLSQAKSFAELLERHKAVLDQEIREFHQRVGIRLEER